MNPTVHLDTRGLTRHLDAIGRKQLPFATARALTDTAHAARVAVSHDLPRVFDRPTPFTRNAVAVQAATKGRLEARVYVKPIQAKYLAVQETGGAVTPKKTAIVLPKAIRRNAYGNMAKGALAAAKRRKDVFVGTSGSVGGFFQRVKRGGQVLLARFIRRATYKPRPFFQVKVMRTGKAVMPVAFRQALARALATARG